MRRTGHLLALGVLLLAVVPATAMAKKHKQIPSAVLQVYRDCTHHNSLTHHYPLSVLEQAYADLPSDVKEYSLCPNEITNAEQQEAAGNRAAPAQTKQQQAQAAQGDTRQLGQARKLGGAPIDLGGEKIPPGAAMLGGSPLTDLPTPILIVLIGLVVLGSVPLALRARRFVRSRRSR